MKRQHYKISFSLFSVLLLINPMLASGSTTYLEDIKDAWKVDGDAGAGSMRYGWFGWRSVYSNDWERQAGYWQHEAVYYDQSSSVHEFTIYWRVGQGGSQGGELQSEVWFYKYSTANWIKQYSADTDNEYICYLIGCPTLYYEEDFDFNDLYLAGYIEDQGNGDYEFSFRLKGWHNFLGTAKFGYHIDEQIVFDFQNV